MNVALRRIAGRRLLTVAVTVAAALGLLGVGGLASSAQEHVIPWEYDVLSGVAGPDSDEPDEMILGSGWHAPPATANAVDIKATAGMPVHAAFREVVANPNISATVILLVRSSEACNRVLVEVVDRSAGLSLAELHWWHVIPDDDIEVGDVIPLVGFDHADAVQIGTIALSPWRNFGDGSTDVAVRNAIPAALSSGRLQDNGLAQSITVGGTSYWVHQMFGEWRMQAWFGGSTRSSSWDGINCGTIGDHLHQGVAESAIGAWRNVDRDKHNGSPVRNDDGLGFDPGGHGYDAPNQGFCRDTWLTKIAPFWLAKPPAATPITPCDAPSDAPGSLVASAGHQSLTLTWSVPSDAPSGYAVRWRRKDGDGPWTGWQPISARDAEATSHAVLGLMDDIAYAVQVRAVTAVGTGPPATVTGTPRVSRLLPSPGEPQINAP